MPDRHGAVNVAPIDTVAGDVVLDDEAVSRRTARVLPGADHQRTVGGQVPLVAAERLLDQAWRAEVPEDRVEVMNAVVGKICTAELSSDIFHSESPRPDHPKT